jgi:hypothetical protein
MGVMIALSAWIVAIASKLLLRKTWRLSKAACGYISGPPSRAFLAIKQMKRQGIDDKTLQTARMTLKVWPEIQKM